MNDNQRFWILVGVGVLFLIQQLAQNASSPVDRSEVDKRKKVIEAYLEAFVVAYYDMLERKHADTLPPVRVNLALPTHGKLPFQWRLRMYYWEVPDGGSLYSADELGMEFKKGEGACGSAWKIKDIVVFDAGNDKLGGATRTIAKKKREFTDGVASVSSVPVLKKGEGGWRFSIDSAFPTHFTQLDSMDVIRLAKSHADALADFCFSDGVK